MTIRSVSIDGHGAITWLYIHKASSSNKIWYSIKLVLFVDNNDRSSLIKNSRLLCNFYIYINHKYALSSNYLIKTISSCIVV